MQSEKQKGITLSENFDTGWYPAGTEDLTLRRSKESDDEWHSGEVKVTLPNGVTKTARGLLTTCGDNLHAASVRFSNGEKSPKHDSPPPIEDSDLRTFPQMDRTLCKFAVSPDAVADITNGFLKLYGPADPRTSYDEAVLSILSTKPKETVAPSPSGLIVVAGGTGTGKSAYAKAIVVRWLIRAAREKYASLVVRAEQEENEFKKNIDSISKEMKGQSDKIKSELSKRVETLCKQRDSARDKMLAKYEPPNLVTFEDPIEGWKFHDIKSNRDINFCESSESDIAFGIRVTARQKAEHVKDIGAAYLDALRQKPHIFYIGECRRRLDWAKAIELGATGHLVVTTCHASSLVDTFAKLAGSNGRDAQSRRTLANSLLGVLHLTRANMDFGALTDTEIAESQTFFHLWRRRAESVSNFVVDGLSSLVSDGENVISRKRFIGDVMNKQQNVVNSYDLKVKDNKSFYSKLTISLQNAAASLDQDGL